MDKTTAAGGPSPDGIFAEGRRHGLATGTALLQLAPTQQDPVATVEFGGIRLAIEAGACCVRGGELPEDLRPAQLTRLAGFLAGIADAYRLQKEARS